jgi:hypothetical protein
VRALAAQAAQDALRAVTDRTFPSGQEARAAGAALHLVIGTRTRTERLVPYAWHCNWADYTHYYPGGPSLCYNPSLGGVDLFHTIVVEEGGDREIDV